MRVTSLTRARVLAQGTSDKVESLLETGANDVIVVKGERERAIPFLQGQTIINIDLDAGCIIVDWDPDF